MDQRPKTQKAELKYSGLGVAAKFFHRAEQQRNHQRNRVAREQKKPRQNRKKKTKIQ